MESSNRIRKIASIISVLGWVGAIGALIVFYYIYNETGEEYMLAVAFIAPIVTFFSFYVSKWKLIGFADLIEDTHSIAKGKGAVEEKIEDKPIPTVEKVIGKCEICHKTDVEIRYTKVKEGDGTRYRNVCPECAKKYSV